MRTRSLNVDCPYCHACKIGLAPDNSLVFNPADIDHDPCEHLAMLLLMGNEDGGPEEGPDALGAVFFVNAPPGAIPDDDFGFMQLMVEGTEFTKKWLSALACPFHEVSVVPGPGRPRVSGVVVFTPNLAHFFAAARATKLGRAGLN